MNATERLEWSRIIESSFLVIGRKSEYVAQTLKGGDKVFQIWKVGDKMLEMFFWLLS